MKDGTHLSTTNDHACPVRNRELDPSLGRWTRQDPLGYVDGGNLLQAYESRPTTEVDSLGLTTQSLPDPGHGGGVGPTAPESMLKTDRGFPNGRIHNKSDRPIYILVDGQWKVLLPGQSSMDTEDADAAALPPEHSPTGSDGTPQVYKVPDGYTGHIYVFPENEMWPSIAGQIGAAATQNSYWPRAFLAGWLVGWTDVSEFGAGNPPNHQ